MKPILSVCTNLFFPKSRQTADDFRRTAAFIAERGAKSMEFFHDGTGRQSAGQVLADNGLSGVLIGVIPLKEGKLNLCSLDEANRLRAVDVARDLLKEAADGGIARLMICSGQHAPGDVDGHMDALVRSIETLYNEKVRKNLPVRIELEPCDSAIDARQFIGPYERTRALCDRLGGMGVQLHLTMDTAHTAEEFQDFPEALVAVKSYCDHIHFANCYLGDERDPLYGDKHLGYEYMDTPFGYAALNDQLIPRLAEIYPGDEALTIGLEVLCREEDPFAYFENTVKCLPVFARAKE